MFKRHGEHEITPKGYGWERTIVNNDRYCGKQIFVLAGKKNSTHIHVDKSETFLCLSGRIRVLTSHEKVKRSVAGSWYTYILCPGDSLDIKAGTTHFFHAIEDTLLVEFSTPHSEADVVRLEKGD